MAFTIEVTSTIEVVTTIEVFPLNHSPPSCPCRSSDTGEGHFYFTGQHAYRLFKGMKHMMSTHSQISSPLPVRADQQSNGILRGRSDREGGSGSESDWTGTGDDWTGASSDSAFINYIRSHHHHGSADRFTSPGMSPSPPPRSSSQGDGIYTNLNPNTLNQDSQYCSIDRLHPVASKSQTTSPSPNRGAPPTSTLLNSVSELVESAEDDEYCKMVPNAGIRAALMNPTSPLPTRPLPTIPGGSVRPALPPHRIGPHHNNSLGEIYTQRE